MYKKCLLVFRVELETTNKFSMNGMYVTMRTHTNKLTAPEKVDTGKTYQYLGVNFGFD